MFSEANTLIRGIRHNLVTSNKYVVRFAQSQEEIEAAQNLRFTVFNLELGEGLPDSYEQQLDADKYDPQCHHLLVIERETEKVIGTYRMQTFQLAQEYEGYYTEEEFDLSVLDDKMLKQTVEVGRACIAKDHRNGRVLFLLWRGLAEYMKQMKSRYLLGCCSITSQDPKEAWEVMAYLEENGHMHPHLKLETTDSFRCPPAEVDTKNMKNIKLPQLFRLYMDIGAKICSPPAIDRDFKTIDYLVLLDIANLDERTRLLFFK